MSLFIKSGYVSNSIFFFERKFTSTISYIFVKVIIYTIIKALFGIVSKICESTSTKKLEFFSKSYRSHISVI